MCVCHIEFMNEFMVLLNDGDVVDHHGVLRKLFSLHSIVENFHLYTFNQDLNTNDVHTGYNTLRSFQMTLFIFVLKVYYI